jgi:hypothetical protein
VQKFIIQQDFKINFKIILEEKQPILLYLNIWPTNSENDNSSDDDDDDDDDDDMHTRNMQKHTSSMQEEGGD